MTDAVYTWLKSQPGLARLERERLAPEPDSAGLFCQGQEVLRRSSDILGNTRIRRRLRFHLAVHGPMPELFLALEQGVRSAPTLGADQTVSVEQGRQTKADGGLNRCQATITFEFTEE